MNKTNMTCRVCGKEYYCCAGHRDFNGYKSMACSPECFKEYMIRIDESRNPKPPEDNITTVKKKAVAKVDTDKE